MINPRWSKTLEATLFSWIQVVGGLVGRFGVVIKVGLGWWRWCVYERSGLWCCYEGMGQVFITLHTPGCSYLCIEPGIKAGSSPQLRHNPYLDQFGSCSTRVEHPTSYWSEQTSSNRKSTGSKTKPTRFGLWACSSGQFLHGLGLTADAVDFVSLKNRSMLWNFGFEGFDFDICTSQLNRRLRGPL